MSIILCDKSHIKELTEFYEKQIVYLDQHINYPRWILGFYPCETSITEKVSKGHQYAYIEDGKIIGAFVLNDDPGGKYENANIVCKRNEYLVIHTLATSYEIYKKGIATKIVRYCIDKAKKEGYKGIYCDIMPNNILSINLFTKLGFKNLGVFDLERYELNEKYQEELKFVICELVF